MDRISRELAFLETAMVWSKRSTCFRRAVGAVVVVNNRIVSHGYNGAAPGEPHCDGMTCVPPGEVGCARALHAEANAVRYVPDSLLNSLKTLYTTESPCVACAALIATRRFEKVYYLNEYRVSAGIRHMLKEDIEVFRMTSSGMIIRKVLVDGELEEELIQ